MLKRVCYICHKQKPVSDFFFISMTRNTCNGCHQETQRAIDERILASQKKRREQQKQTKNEQEEKDERENKNKKHDKKPSKNNDSNNISSDIYSPILKLKRCCTCKEEKAETAFNFNKNTPSGRAWDCRDCRKKAREEGKRQSENDEEQSRNILAGYLKNIRQSKNMTQKQIADKIGVTQKFFGMLENAKRKIPNNFAERLKEKYLLNKAQYEELTYLLYSETKSFKIETETKYKRRMLGYLKREINNITRKQIDDIQQILNRHEN